LYLKQLQYLHGGPFDNLLWLKDVDGIKKKLGQKKCTSRKVGYSAIVTVLKVLKNDALATPYGNLLFEALTECAKIDPNKKTEKQEANWMSWADIEKIFDGLEFKAKGLATLKKLNTTNYDTMLRYMVLALYVTLPPGRNVDYVAMMVMPKKGDGVMPTDYNWLDLRTNTMIFNKFKTVADMGQQKVSFGSRTRFVEALNRYLKYNPHRSDTLPYHFLVRRNGNEMNDSLQLTKFLNKIFAPKMISSSMLRHIYLSDKYDVEEMKKDAELMRHSEAMQHDYLKS
jgi:hypothetical protein